MTVDHSSPPLLTMYAIRYTDPEAKNYTEYRAHATRGKALYAAFASYSEYSDITFLDYQKIVSVSKIGDTRILKPENYKHQDRIDAINKIIRSIGSYDHRLFYNQKTDQYCYFYWAKNKLWYVDSGSGYPMIMDEKQDQKNHIHKAFFVNGGTLWGLVCDFKDYIYGHDHMNGVHGYGGLYGTAWGYSDNSLTQIQKHAQKVGYLSV